jgi:hypothetical protein
MGRPTSPGAVGAMAMTGMRVVTTELGLVEQARVFGALPDTVRSRPWAGPRRGMTSGE